MQGRALAECLGGGDGGSRPECSGLGWPCRRSGCLLPARRSLLLGLPPVSLCHRDPSPSLFLHRSLCLLSPSFCLCFSLSLLPSGLPVSVPLPCLLSPPVHFRKGLSCISPVFHAHPVSPHVPLSRPLTSSTFSRPSVLEVSPPLEVLLPSVSHSAQGVLSWVGRGAGSQPWLWGWAPHHQAFGCTRRPV